MIKLKEAKCLVKPIDIVPSSKNLRVLGAINPAAMRLPNRDILLYVRIIERIIASEDENHYFSPRFSGKKDCKIESDKFSKKNVKIATELDFSFKDGTKRLSFISHFRKVILAPDGLTVKKIDKEPTFFGLKGDGELGVEDPRMTLFEDGRYLMTYVTLARESNVSTSYATSSDLKNWKRGGIIFREQNKDVVIFPEKINGKYFAINRPEGNFQFSNPDMCVAESDDLVHWGKQTEFGFRKKKGWDSGRVGAGPPPIRTRKGWLLIYHGVIEEEKRSMYAVGAALLNLKNPRKIIAKTYTPLILPREDYEKGDLEKKNVIFPTGLVQHENGEDLLIYSGGGDVNTTVKQVSLKDVMKAMRRV